MIFFHDFHSFVGHVSNHLCHSLTYTIIMVHSCHLEGNNDVRIQRQMCLCNHRIIDNAMIGLRNIQENVKMLKNIWSVLFLNAPQDHIMIKVDNIAYIPLSQGNNAWVRSHWVGDMWRWIWHQGRVVAAHPGVIDGHGSSTRRIDCPRLKHHTIKEYNWIIRLNNWIYFWTVWCTNICIMLPPTAMTYM